MKSRRRGRSTKKMPPSLTTLLSPLLFLIIAANTWAFNTRQGECMFPVRWEGTWFQSGVRQPILISRHTLSSKGRCLQNEGDKFLLVDEKSCYRCVVIHEKHSNVLQYKETYCHGRNSLSSLCSYITGDALLYSMFREEAPAVPCPFRGPMTFSYNRGHGTCSSPQSNVDTCTDDSRLLFRYQACPDVPASESAVEELECLATWKEGSSRYLVGRLHHHHASSNEDRYRCFVYERAGQAIGSMSRGGLGIGAIEHEATLPGAPIPEGAPEIYRVAQSGDATCNGLFSPMEGSRTMTLRKAPSPGKCRFPSWLTGYTSGGLTWHTLDLARSYTFHPKNASLHVSRSNTSAARSESGQMEGQDVPGQDEQDVKILCNSVKQSNPTQTMMMLVAHFTVGCRSGYMCMTFYRRDGHVTEVQTGKAVSRAEEACSSPHYLPHSIQYVTLVTSSPEPTQCPYLGKFTVTGLNRNQRNTRENRRNHDVWHENEKVRHAQDKTDERHNRKEAFDIEARRANNDYLVHEHRGRKTRSSKAKGTTLDLRVPEVQQTKHDTRRRFLKDIIEDSSTEKVHEKENRRKRSPGMVEYFQVDMDEDGNSQDNEYGRIMNVGARSELQKVDDEAEGEVNKEIQGNVRSDANSAAKRIGNEFGTLQTEETKKDADSNRYRRSLRAKEDLQTHVESAQQRPDFNLEMLQAESIREIEGFDSRYKRSPKIEDFHVDLNDFTMLQRSLVPKDEDAETPSILQAHFDYFGDYDSGDPPPKKRDIDRNEIFSYRDLLRMKRDLEDDGDPVERRGKRGEEETRCNSEVTTLTVGCSTADRMEFQSDCVDDDAITAYSCHGRWFDAEGTQFVIATPLARRTSWSNDNNRPQPFRNSRRLCFMYRESGGVVSLTASPIACQRGVPSPPPMLAFNATSIGQCMEENTATARRASYLPISLITIIIAIFR